MSIEPDASLLPKAWEEAVFDGGPTQEEFYARVDGLYSVGPADSVFPRRPDVFRAFHLTPLSGVKVVILGQDPYPKKDQAHGLAFSVPEGQNAPRSLGAIYRNLEGDTSIDFTRPKGGDLTQWGRNGVLLLNTALTVQDGRPGSHDRFWADFTNLVLQAVADEERDVAFLLWGTHAATRASRAGITASRPGVIVSAHPAARGRAKALPFSEIPHFSRANAFLNDPIDWHLPTGTH